MKLTIEFSRTEEGRLVTRWFARDKNGELHALDMCFVNKTPDAERMISFQDNLPMDTLWFAQQKTELASYILRCAEAEYKGAEHVLRSLEEVRAHAG